MRRLYLLILFLVPLISSAKVSVDPSITPSLFRYNDQITVSYDVTGTSLASLPNAFIWVWIPDKNTNAKYNVNPASSNITLSNSAKFTKSTDGGKTIFSITFTPSDFFATDISGEVKLGMLLKGNDWNGGNDQTADYEVNFWDGSFQVNLIKPSKQPLFVQNGDDITIEAEVPVDADFDLFVDNVLTTEQNGAKLFSYIHTVSETSGSVAVKLVAASGVNSNDVSFQYIISTLSPAQPRPTGIVPGINYSTDHTKVTLCLLAPGKNSVYVQGDFSDWEFKSQYLMNKDGEYFWLELNGLVPFQEYSYRYLIDESIYVADPYADKILDPDDQYIPALTYPGLKIFPSNILSGNWYDNRVAVFQTNQTAYNWQNLDFQKPAKEKLVIYELLIRDFFGSGSRSYNNLIDTLSYFKRLGVNAIQLMPIMEFNGNEGWGYNPTFMLAPDKYYGTKNKLKEFIDKCHEEGIAVIFDIAMNHHDLPNPYVMMDFDFAAFKPTVNNKWFNTDAKHPYNVFFDMNHESSYTKTYLDSITHYWINEYHIDGYRFDLSKGFTQTNNPSNVNAWGAYDASRVALLKRMADKIWTHTPDAYVILEHFAANNEEKELAEYKLNEGKGMMLWGNLNHAYAQNTMGFSSESDINWIYSGSRGWSADHAIGYMESHDEERLMYKNLTFGNTSGSYSTKDLATALNRIKAASVIFYTIPGPKMLWQFGDLGFDYSINQCEDGSISNDCRLSPKPVPWDYQNDPKRASLFNIVSDLIRLKNTYDVFSHGDATISGGTSLQKQLTLKNNPYKTIPANADEMNAQVVVNFELTQKDIQASFPHTGVWYDYYTKQELNVTSTPFSITLEAGGYKLYTDYPIENQLITSTNEELRSRIKIFPIPAKGVLNVQADQDRIQQVRLLDLTGSAWTLSSSIEGVWEVGYIPTGLYIAEVHTTRKNYRVKVVIEN